MTTKVIQALQEKTRAIQDAARLNQEEATVALAEKFPSPVVGPPANDTSATLTGPVPPPDWEALQAFIAQELELSRLRLEKAAREYAQEIQDDPSKRQEWRAVIDEAYQRFLRVRHILEEAIGEAKTYELLGVTGTTPQRPQTLLTHMQSASDRLRNPKRLPESLAMPGMTLSWADLAAALDRDASRLAEALDRQREERRRADLALLRKDRVQTAVNDTYVGLTKVLDGLYIAAGQREMAARLRLTIPTSSGGGGEPQDDGSLPDVVPTPDFPANDEEPFPVAAAQGAGPGTEDPKAAGVRPIVVLPAGARVLSDDDS